MGNQQERSLAWMAGIIDGEGSISVQVYTLPDGRVRLTPFVSIVNSDFGILEECRRILEEMDVKFRDCRKPLSEGSFAGKKICSNIRIDGQKPVYEFLPILLPYLKSEKKVKAAIVMAYLVSRMTNGIQRNEKGHIKRLAYTRDEIEMVSSIRSHPRAKSSEAICQAPNVVG